ncbi:MAG: hypothetical protein HY921_12085 [Elusimicrobia bacterium]|nr:hypothetical protein [Elusimicrobiota bacterium]
MSQEEKRLEAAWSQYFNMIREQFPYSKWKDVRISKGAVVDWGRVEFTELLSRGEEPPPEFVPEDFNWQWRHLRRRCEALRDCVIAEIHFTHGRPVQVVYAKENGRMSNPADCVRFPLIGQQQNAQEVMMAAV